MNIENMSSIRKNFIANQLCSQINALQSVLTNIEERQEYYANCAEQSVPETIKKIESNLRHIRKLCSYN